MAKVNSTRGKSSSSSMYSKLVPMLVEYISDYMAISTRDATIISAWVLAAWNIDCWSKFPHLCITSPEKRCGKTTLLWLLKQLTPVPIFTTNISPAVIYRLIQSKRPTLLLDEAQSLSRQNSEQSIVIRELLNAGIEKDAVIYRCGGEGMVDILEFRIYSPKVFALIGDPDEVLADRSIIISLKRRTKQDKIETLIEPIAEKRAAQIVSKIKVWAKDKKTHKAMLDMYTSGEKYDISNDRMAALLRPLTASLRAANHSDVLLQSYARSIDQKDAEQEMQSPGVRLLVACFHIFGKREFVSTVELVEQLCARSEEPWGRWCNGRPITNEALASMLRKYKIKPKLMQFQVKGKRKSMRGYSAISFKDAWSRYSNCLV